MSVRKFRSVKLCLPVDCFVVGVRCAALQCGLLRWRSGA